MPKLTYKQYQKIIRKGAWEKFSKEWGIKGSIFSLLVSTAAGFVWWIIFGGFDSFFIALVVMGLSFLSLMVFYIGYFNREHMLVYNDQNDDYERLQKTIKEKPILRIREYGNEHKKIYQRFENKIIGDYDTLYIDVYNKQTKSDAKRVWSKIEWIEGSTTVLSHHGRWHIASDTLDNEPIRENLRYRDIYSNQSVQRLYFAWTYFDGRENSFHGLERNMDGNDSWGTKKHLLNGKEYKVKITLQGNDDVHQEFIYVVTNHKGKISMRKALKNAPKQEEDTKIRKQRKAKRSPY